MNKSWKDILKGYFSYSNKEKRGLFALAIILLLTILTVQQWPNWFPAPSVLEHHPQKDSILALFNEEESRVVKNKQNTSLVSCEPVNLNSANLQQLIKAGFTEMQAATILKFRGNRSPFQSIDDFRKLYFVTEDMLEQWQNCLIFPARVKDAAPITQITSIRDVPLKQKRDLNLIDSLTLISINGVGAKTAGAILDYRRKLGGFISVDQLNEVRGIHPNWLDTIKLQLEIQDPLINKIAINSCDEELLRQHPYIGYKAKIILAYRSQHNGIRGKDELAKVGVFKPEEIERMLPYLDFSF